MKDNNFYKYVDTACKEYPGLRYLDDEGKAISQQSAKDILEPGYYKGQGQNRSIDLQIYASSLHSRFWDELQSGLMDREYIYELVLKANRTCQEPYPEQKVRDNVNQSYNYVAKKKEEEVRLEKVYNDYINGNGQSLQQQQPSPLSDPDPITPSDPPSTPLDPVPVPDLISQPDPVILPSAPIPQLLPPKPDPVPPKPGVEDWVDSIPERDYVEYIINIIKRTVKCEDVLIRHIVYTILSKDTVEPLNLAILAPTSEGKTYPVVETLGIFPQKDIWYIGGMSPMVLVRQKGVLVDRNNQPIQDEVKRIKKEIFLLGNGKLDKRRAFDLKDELNNLLEDSKRLIDFSNKIIVFLDAPHPELWDKIKPILSHDKFEVEFPYVDKSNDRSGMSVQNIVVRGYPSCIFCSAKDESRWPQWPEIASRFLITSPNMIQKKYLESNILIAQRKGLPGILQQQIIRSDEDILLAKLCVEFLNEQIQTICDSKHPPVWIPYYNYLGSALPSNKGTDNRTTKRIFSLLNIIPLAKANLRDRLVYDVETLVIAAIEDLDETLCITNNVTGIPTFKMRFFKEVFYPLEKTKDVPDKSGGKEERFIGVTTRQLCDYYREIYHKTITSDNLKKTYLLELLNGGIIDEEPSVIDQRQHIYRSLMDMEDEIHEYRNYTNMRPIDNILSPYNIRTPKSFVGIPEKWLLLEILGLLNYRVGFDKIAVLSHRLGERMTITNLCEMYEKNNSLTRYFSMPKYTTFRSAIFGAMKYLGVIRRKTDEQLSNGDGFVYFRQFDESKHEETSSKGVKFDEKDKITVESVPKESWTAKIIAPNVEQENNSKKHSLYWSPNMGKWGCNDCSQKGDKFDMQGVCKAKWQYQKNAIYGSKDLTVIRDFMEK